MMVPIWAAPGLAGTAYKSPAACAEPASSGRQVVSPRKRDAAMLYLPPVIEPLTGSGLTEASGFTRNSAARAINRSDVGHAAGGAYRLRIAWVSPEANDPPGRI
jgi:hypothetical protein